MHRGYGYLQNYLDGHNLPSLPKHLDSIYKPVFKEESADLYVARMWDERSAPEESSLIDQNGVTGLVFSSFRFDNPGPVARGDWRIK
jgi:hypothetical protein